MSNTLGEIRFLAQLREQILRSASSQVSQPKVRRSSRRRTAITLVAAGVTLTAAVLAVSLPDGDGPATPRFGLSIEHPLLDGERVPAEVAQSAVERQCGTCLDQSSLPEIEAAYLDSNGGVGLVLSDGTWIVLTPDGRTSGAYVEDVKPLLNESESPFRLIDLRGVQALSTDETQLGPAGLTWVEGGYLFEVVGPPGTQTPALVVLAESL